MINKQSMWFLTLLSLVLVLGVYYVTMPNDLLKTSINGEEKNKKVDVKVSEGDILIAMRANRDEKVALEIEELESVLSSNTSSSEEKNSAFEELKLLNLNIGKEEELETKIEEGEKSFANKAIEERLATENIDVTEPSKKMTLGSVHPITQVVNDVKEIFIGMGYQIADGPEIELATYNFDKLNTPPDHPARDIQDTFYITDDIILRSQTSSVQARVMESQKPPIKIICPGSVYRSDSVDATHSPVFHQIEGLVIDKNVSMADLKGTLEVFMRKMLGSNTQLRFRPSYFPFTEPSYEVDVSCFKCGGKGCNLCKQTGWIEVLGAGIVHPNVLKMNGYDPEQYGGFAFGTGIDRLAMFRYGITDMRYLYANDVRFLSQFDRKDEE